MNPARTEPARTVSDSIVVDAPAAVIFDLLADPQRHGAIDGSGSLLAPVQGPARLGLGDTFGMKMRIVLPYRVTNTVVEFELDRRIAWQHAARHVWRYELSPDGPDRTTVTETWDWSGSPVARPMELMKFPAKNTQSIRRTLRRLKQVIEDGTG